MDITHHEPQVLALQPGTLAPEFTLGTAVSPSSDELSLRDLRGETVVLAFSPPGWNPSREQQLHAFNEILAEVGSPSAQLLSIESDGIWCDLDVLDDAGREQLRLPLLRDFDPTGAIARRYGVYGEHAVFVVDGAGFIRWSHVAPAGMPPDALQVLEAVRALDSADETTAESSELSSKLSRRGFLASALAASLALAASPHLAAPAQAQDIGAQTTGALYRGNQAAVPRGAGAMPVSLKVNGATHQLSIEPRVTLLDALREYIGLTGTKKGCNHGQCGACTVLVNGERINSCLTLAMQVEGDSITTVEGLARGGELHAVQAAFIEHDGFQCGYCTPGQICSAVALLSEAQKGSASAVTSRAELTSNARPALSDEEIRERMSGNLCRCGAYNGIVEAVREAASKSGIRSA